MLAVGNTISLDDAAVPIPLSFPSLLRNPGIASRYAHLSEATTPDKLINQKKHRTPKRYDNEGKRWIRRKENARFAGNTHIVNPGSRDYLPPPGPQIRSTFPEPLPVYLSRNSKLPGVLPTPEHRNAANADCGRFSMGLRGMRRDLRRMGFRSKPLVVDVETELVAWLEAGGTLLSPDTLDSTPNSSGTPIGTGTTIVEISRTPLQLIWQMTDDSDAFARYVVHCTARYHKIVSFSKEVSGQRLTYLLRPHVKYPEYHAANFVDTPPATDLDISSQLDTDSEFASDHDTRSEAGDSVPDSTAEHMSTIDEDSVSLIPPTTVSDDDWSDAGDVDTDDGESGGESRLGQSFDSLGGDPDDTVVIHHRLAQLSLRSRPSGLATQNRSTSSPSRSPVRPARRNMQTAPSAPQSIAPKSFYEYLFS
ncbi:hypothetical protein C8R47DRAFT_1052916 [Mycena vitilis]|nr:hypothetical protein C8R47DRAFT_1052916 [Mycena vitilis]